jgi:hypothetical protein
MRTCLGGEVGEVPPGMWGGATRGSSFIGNKVVNIFTPTY